MTTQNVLELARRCGVQSIVYLSSMELYGAFDCGLDHQAAENYSALWRSRFGKFFVFLYPAGMLLAFGIIVDTD